MRADYIDLDKKHLVLPARLHMSLTTDEWKPLIMTKLLLLSFGLARRRKGLLTWAIVSMIIYGMFAILTIPGELSVGRGAVFVQIPVAFLTILGSRFVTRFLFGRTVRHDILRADQQVATLFGKDSYRDVLTKLEQLGEDHSHGKKTRIMPSIQERLQNLSNTASE